MFIRTPQCDCFENSLDKEKEIDLKFAASWKLSDEEAEKLIKKLRLERLQTVYKVDYGGPGKMVTRDTNSILLLNVGIISALETDAQNGDASILPASKKKGKHFESELLRYLDDLYYNPHDEKVLAPPITGKRGKTWKSILQWA